MASENNCDENLTIDAFPSPPRENNVGVEEVPYKFEEENEPKSTSASYKTDKKKPKKPTPVNVTRNFFNISNANGIHIGPNYTLNMSKQEKADNQSEKIQKTDAIRNLLRCTDPVTLENLSFVSDHIGENWKKFARRLGCSEGQIHQFFEDHHIRGLKEVVYQILLDWKQFNADRAQVGVLFTALWKAKEVDVVQRMTDKVQTNNS